MDSDRRTARIVGVLFIIATVAGILSVILLPSIQDAPNNLANFSANEYRVLLGSLLILVMAFACAGIAIWLYPVLKKHNQALALGSVGFRVIESVLHIVVVIATLLLLTLSQEYVNAGALDASHFQTSSELLVAANDSAAVLGSFAFGLGAIMYYYIFYRSNLIPRWLSGWGLVAITLMIINAFFNMFGFYNNFSPISVLVQLPILVQEMVLAAWLIVKGFNPSEIVAKSMEMEK